MEQIYINIIIVDYQLHGTKKHNIIYIYIYIVKVNFSGRRY